MSDFRNYDYRNPEDPLLSDPQLDPNVRPPNPAWGWIAAAIFLVVVLAVAFGYGHKPGQLGTNTALNDHPAGAYPYDRAGSCFTAEHCRRRRPDPAGDRNAK